MADVSNAVRQKADALMLSGESAMGLHPQKAIEVLRGVSLRMEHWNREEGHAEAVPLPEISTTETGRTSEQICNSAAQIGTLLVSPLLSMRASQPVKSRQMPESFCFQSCTRKKRSPITTHSYPQD